MAALALAATACGSQDSDLQACEGFIDSLYAYTEEGAGADEAQEMYAEAREQASDSELQEIMQNVSGDFEADSVYNLQELLLYCEDNVGLEV